MLDLCYARITPKVSCMLCSNELGYETSMICTVEKNWDYKRCCQVGTLGHGTVAGLLSSAFFETVKFPVSKTVI